MRGLSLCVFASALALGSPETRGTCTCSVPSIAQALSKSEAAFVGTVHSAGLDPEKEKRVVTFTVQRVFKGSVPVRVQVVTPLTEGGCGYSFAGGTTYLVFTRNIQGKRLTHLCSGNIPAHPSGPWPKELDIGWSPTAADSYK
jgi:hypothetical protein